MQAIEALRLVEQKLVPARTIAGVDTEWAEYRRTTLPAVDNNSGFTDAKATLMQQGFEAGYTAAMSAARGILADVQTQVLREPEES